MWLFGSLGSGIGQAAGSVFRLPGTVHSGMEEQRQGVMCWNCDLPHRNWVIGSLLKQSVRQGKK